VSRLGVLLMTYGSPDSLDDMGRYLAAVRGGREPAAELVAEFRRRYELIGGSPLIPITRAQAVALEERLGDGSRVEVGMRFSEPVVAAGLRRLADDGCDVVVGIVMSPQYSDLLMAGYRGALDAASAELGDGAPEVRLAPAWYRNESFLEAVAQRIAEGLADLPDGAPVLLTAHSLPRRVADAEPGYLAQLRETADAVAARAQIGEWRFCWQSAGHEPGEWMKPDFTDVLPELRAAGHRSVLAAPIQFLADHLEVLYDIDIGAREQAEAAGMSLARIESLNVMPRFIQALAEVVRATASARSAA
jgi:protoporphyrin/coproporphyrin ferrochelatase